MAEERAKPSIAIPANAKGHPFWVSLLRSNRGCGRPAAIYFNSKVILVVLDYMRLLQNAWERLAGILVAKSPAPDWSMEASELCTMKEMPEIETRMARRRGRPF